MEERPISSETWENIVLCKFVACQPNKDATANTDLLSVSTRADDEGAARVAAAHVGPTAGGA